MSTVADIIQRDTRANQPAAGSTPAGTLYYVTDESVTERCTGSAWEDVSDAGSAGSVATDAIWDTAGDLALGSGANTAAKLAIGSNDGEVLQVVSSAVAWAEPKSLIGYKVNTTSNAYSTTSATLADVDATNMVVTFTVPPSGAVLVELNGFADCTGSSGEWTVWGIREATSDIGAACAVARSPNATGGIRLSAQILVTGLTPAASKTYKWSFAVSGGVTSRILNGAGGTATSPVSVMKVFAL